MGLLESIVRGLAWFFCGPKSPLQPHSEEDVYAPPSVPHKLEEHKPHVAQPPSYAHPHPYPPSQQQQQQQQQPVTLPQPQKPQYTVRTSNHDEVECSLTDPNAVGSSVQKFEDNRQNPLYLALRKRADEVAVEMHKLSRESQEAYQRGDGALAKELSLQSKAKRGELERLNQENAEWLFRENNKDRPVNEIDLHGMTVDQAIEFSERAIQSARQRGDSEIHIIVGKGLHSAGGIPKIKPAIEALMVKYQLIAELDPNNSGVLIVSLGGHDTGTGNVVRPDEIARRIDERDDRCIVM
ncbi:hypothetical protein BDY19DRAFT_882495 [Irpex rosettiformis]|uniref:Uncharacterized protein n=1 Tax=Irpex rosettiformis TaxID=378272 RepID=A0ACB8UGM1_9APHY|nr:hypothetical protein BDY19DRAFT_882495 [Irpex rosettiformis]